MFWLLTMITIAAGVGWIWADLHSLQKKLRSLQEAQRRMGHRQRLYSRRYQQDRTEASQRINRLPSSSDKPSEAR